MILAQAGSDAMIALSYYSIPFLLLWLTRKRKEQSSRWFFVSFAVFIVSCGTTHIMEIWNIWHANYWASATVKIITALASLATAITLFIYRNRAAHWNTDSKFSENLEKIRELTERLGNEGRYI